MQCPNCKTPNAVGSSFCRVCGTPLNLTQQHQQKSVANKICLALAKLSGLLSIVVILYSIIALNTRESYVLPEINDPIVEEFYTPMYRSATVHSKDGLLGFIGSDYYYSESITESDSEYSDTFFKLRAINESRGDYNNVAYSVMGIGGALALLAFIFFAASKSKK